MSVEATVQVAGRYRLDTVVGKGSSAEVWSAWDTVLSRAVALKLLGPRSDLEKSRIWREARLAALLGDSAAVPIYDFGDDGDHCFLVMELVSEPSLREFLNDNPDLGQNAKLTLGRHLLESLTTTHALSIIHRDIKPENLFVVGTSEQIQRVRLVDFGLAFVEEKSNTSLGRLTETGVLSGTPAYLSPEQAKGEPLDAATDVYSAGCVLYEVACGMPPFGGSLAEVLSKHMYVPPIPLREREVELPDVFIDLVETMLAKTAGDRVSAAEALAIVTGILEGSPNTGGRRADRSKQQSRADRMIDAPVGEPDAQEARAIHASADGSPPDWLLDTLENAHVILVESGQSADMHLMAADGVIPDGTTPCVVWLDEATTDALTDVISRGANFAVLRQTRANKLRRAILRLSKQSENTSD